MLSCKDVSRLVSEGQERSLRLRERLVLRLHLWMCVRCRRFERQLVLMRRALRMLGSRYEQDARNADLSSEARGRIRKVLAETERREHPHQDE